MENSNNSDNQKPVEKKTVKIGKIVVDRNLCIGAASCLAVAPGVFELDAENKAVVHNDKGADDETILLAAQSCPTRAIILFDEEGKQIYPVLKFGKERLKKLLVQLLGIKFEMPIFFKLLTGFILNLAND